MFWGRGTYDTVIPEDYVERTMKWLLQHSTLTARTYEMGHTDSVAELADVAALVAAHIGNRKTYLPGPAGWMSDSWLTVTPTLTGQSQTP